MLIVPPSERYLEIRVLTNIDRFSKEYQEWASDPGPDLSEILVGSANEVGKDGYTREQCEDIGLPFRPKADEEPLEVVFEWRYSKRLLDFYNVSEVQDITGKRGFVIWRFDGSGLICRGSYKKFLESFLKFKIKQTEFENVKELFTKSK